MDELDGYIARVLGVEAVDLAEMDCSASPVRAPVSQLSVQRRRVAPFTALAASVMFGVVLVVALRMGGEGREHRNYTASAPSRMATFIEEASDPNLATQPARSSPASGAVRTSPPASSKSTSAETATTKARKVRTNRASGPMQMARAPPKTLGDRTRLRALASEVAAGEDASAPRAIKVIDTAAEDRLDAIDAIRLLRQR